MDTSRSMNGRGSTVGDTSPCNDAVHRPKNLEPYILVYHDYNTASRFLLYTRRMILPMDPIVPAAGADITYGI
jgi:hypothetical protein